MNATNTTICGEGQRGPNADSAITKVWAAWHEEA